MNMSLWTTSLIDSPQGRAIVPGHAIESMWFMIHIYAHWGDQQRINEAVADDQTAY